MKQTLLSIILGIFCLPVFGQILYDAPDILECGEDPVSLSEHTPILLGDQYPSLYTVTYHYSPAEAQTGTNAIPDPVNYNDGIVTVYARTLEMATGNFSVSSFQIYWNFTEHEAWFADVAVCDSYLLPPLDVGKFYTAPGGQGIPLDFGSEITTTMVIYYFATNGECTAEHSFVVTVFHTPQLLTNSLERCIGEDMVFNLTSVSPGLSTYHHSESEALSGANPIGNPQAYEGYDEEIVYVATHNGMCFSIEMVSLFLRSCTPYTILGKVRLSQNDAVCRFSDPVLPNCAVQRTFGGETYYSFTNSQGDYLFTNVEEGVSAVSADAYQAYIPTVLPASANVTVNAANPEGAADFCAQEIPYADVDIQTWALSVFRPGFLTPMHLRIANLANSTVTGTVVYTYNDGFISFVSATQTPLSAIPGQLTFSYSLEAHSVLEIEMLFSTPLTTEVGQQLLFTASTDLVDDAPENNSALAYATVVNSYDPNDITVLQGPFISESQTGDYLQYVVRFQNTGTAEALNIRVESELSEFLDASTFQPISASHIYFPERHGNDISFFFPNIDLAAEQDDEPASHGYFAYEVKPAAGFSIGDVIEAQAAIFFDTNEPIITNTATTQISILGHDDFALSDVSVFPNPASDEVVIRSTQAIDSVEIYNVDGKKVLSGRSLEINVSGLASGIYFAKIASGQNHITKKLIIQ